jgi:hypothetical protein
MQAVESNENTEIRPGHSQFNEMKHRAITSGHHGIYMTVRH